MVEESESESESVVAGDQEGEDVEENPSDAAGDGDGESAGTLVILLKSNRLVQSAGVFGPHSLSSFPCFHLLSDWATALSPRKPTPS